MVNGAPGWGGYYLSAYGLAVKHGYTGSEEEWLDYLKGADVQMRYEDGVLQWKHDEAEQWNTLEEFTVFQQDVLEKAQNAQAAADRANASAEGADEAKNRADASSEKADASAAKAKAAAENADGAAEKAGTAAETANTSATKADAAAEIILGVSEALEAHKADAAQHLTADEKAFLDKPYEMFGYTGNGSARVQYALDTSPTAVFVFAQGRPSAVNRTDGKTDTYFEYWLKWGTKEYSTGGIFVKPEDGAIAFANGYVSGTEAYTYHRLNEKYVLYLVLMI